MTLGQNGKSKNNFRPEDIEESSETTMTSKAEEMDSGIVSFEDMQCHTELIFIYP